MPTYLARFFCDSRVRINQRSYAPANERSRHTLQFSDFEVAVFDQMIEVGSVFMPSGLLLQTTIPADNLSSAIDLSRGVVGNYLSIYSLVARASVGIPFAQWIYDATPNAADREIALFIYEPALSLKTRAVDTAILEDVLNRLGDALFAGAIQDPDDRERLHWALTGYRRALADNDDVLSELVAHWSCAEALDKIYRQQVLRGGWHGHKAQMFDGMRATFERLGQLQKFQEVKDARDGVAHGLKPLRELVQVATENIDLVRGVSVDMLLSVLQVKEDERNRVEGQASYKGRYLSHFRIFGSGQFAPGSVNELDGHPLFEIDRTVEADADGDQVHVRPQVRAILRSEGSFSFDRTEVWGENAAKLVISDSNLEVLKADQSV